MKNMRLNKGNKPNLLSRKLPKIKAFTNKIAKKNHQLLLKAPLFSQSLIFCL